ncbi:CDC42 small effector protein 2 isoform X1 [Latimeria chalumnae]|uniref:CDC42 small effector protein 2 isoform X1 n=1 Tax=Latimeria chalumnae TaxID=7897 RepID=UPI0006D9102B|nr:PREDICTED: CDC42 small effector protein 2 isoform X1 [Latimeria chalumnae]|eukprot:XP_014346396.1 PREDICTED: CDC42 small effector protein 2 isoform X1 [Latimeria chalumnae]
MNSNLGNLIGQGSKSVVPQAYENDVLRSQNKRRRRIDRSMIGEPTNFVHTAHVGSGDLFSGMNSVNSIQNQMQSKGGYGGAMPANVQMQLVDTKAG